jgi:hypothetical protein
MYDLKLKNKNDIMIYGGFILESGTKIGTSVQIDRCA